jgi:hypothetical protein
MSGLWWKSRGPIGYADMLNQLRSAMRKLKTVEELFKGRHFERASSSCACAGIFASN